MIGNGEYRTSALTIPARTRRHTGPRSDLMGACLMRILRPRGGDTVTSFFATVVKLPGVRLEGMTLFLNIRRNGKVFHNDIAVG
jgi:hypothetical protein